MPSRVRSIASFVAAALIVAVFTTGPLYRVRSWWSFEDPLDADVWIVTVLGLIGVLGVVVLASGGRWRRVAPVPGALAAALVGWMVLSATWSVDPAVTLRAGLLIGGTLAAGAAAATVLSSTALLWAVWAGTQLGLAWSAIEIWRIGPGSQDAEGFWTGVFFNRNSLALVAAIGLLVGGLLALGLVTDGSSWRSRAVPAFALLGAGMADLVLLLGSDSLTPLLAVSAAAGALVLAVAARSLRRRGLPTGPLVAVAGVVAVAVAVIGWALRGPLADAVGRNSDFSGRAQLWHVSWEWFLKRPLLGQGYLAAWHDDAFLADVLAERGEILPSAHNSFVEVLLGTGVLGVALVLGLVVALYWIVGRRAVDGDTARDLWPLALFVFVIVEQLSETLLVSGQITVALLGALLVIGDDRGEPRSGPRGVPRARQERGAEGDPLAPQPAGVPAAADRR